MYTSDVEGLDAFAKRYTELKKEIAKVIVGQEDIVSKLLISIFCGIAIFSNELGAAIASYYRVEKILVHGKI